MIKHFTLLLFLDFAFCWGRSLVETSNNDFIIIGRSSNQFFMKKVNNYGDEIWSKFYGDGEIGDGWSIVKDNDESLLGLGKINTGDSNNMEQFYLVKIDLSGDTLWTKKYGHQ